MSTLSNSGSSLKPQTKVKIKAQNPLFSVATRFLKPDKTTEKKPKYFPRHGSYVRQDPKP